MQRAPGDDEVRTLGEACRVVMEDTEVTARYPKGLNGGDVLMEIRTRFGANAWPLVSVLDVIDELTALYGRPGR